MLAQNFKTPAELKITDEDFRAHAKVLGMLERGELHHMEGGYGYLSDPFGFNMGDWHSKSACGTVACIGGWVALLTDRKPRDYVYGATGPLNDLYFPKDSEGVLSRCDNITTDQAAIALRNYLTTGEPRWEEALAD